MVVSTILRCGNGVEECEIPSDYKSTGLVPAYNPDTTGETDRMAMQQALGTNEDGIKLAFKCKGENMYVP